MLRETNGVLGSLTHKYIKWLQILLLPYGCICYCLCHAAMEIQYSVKYTYLQLVPMQL